MKNKIALGGGCHWCTEAVFQSLRGVLEVEQGFVASTGNDDSYSEAVIVHYDDNIISLGELIEIHLHSHSSTSDHQLRYKYRSAIYTFDKEQFQETDHILRVLAENFERTLVTRALPFRDFQPSEKRYHEYYQNNPNKPFCETFIKPKLRKVAVQFPDNVDQHKAASYKLISSYNGRSSE